MTDTVVSEIETSMDEGTQAVVPKPKPKARQSSSKPRAEARPYKKYDLLNLEGQITKMKKQAELQRSRLLFACNVHACNEKRNPSVPPHLDGPPVDAWVDQ